MDIERMNNNTFDDPAGMNSSEATSPETEDKNLSYLADGEPVEITSDEEDDDIEAEDSEDETDDDEANVGEEDNLHGNIWNALEERKADDFSYLVNSMTSSGITSLNEKVVPVNNIVDKLSDDEKAVNDEEAELITKLKRNKSICNRLQGFARLTSGCNGLLLASINEKDGKRICRVTQQYSDGSFSGIFEIKQADLFIVFTYLRFLNQSEIFGAPDDEDSREMKKRAKKIISSIQDDYFNAAKGYEYMSVKDIVMTLMMSYNQLSKLPSEEETYSQAAELFFQVVHYIENSPIVLNPLFVHKSKYYLLTDNDIQQIAMSVDVPAKRMLELFKQSGFLYLTPSSIKYKTKVRCKDNSGDEYIERFVCLFKPDFVIATNEE